MEILLAGNGEEVVLLDFFIFVGNLFIECVKSVLLLYYYLKIKCREQIINWHMLADGVL